MQEELRKPEAKQALRIHKQKLLVHREMYISSGNSTSHASANVQTRTTANLVNLDQDMLQLIVTNQVKHSSKDLQTETGQGT